jgi:hypothetical protein
MIPKHTCIDLFWRHCCEFLCWERWWVFPCHGCTFGCGCHIINSCLICCNTALQKLLCLLSRHNVSDAWGQIPYDEVFDHLWDSLAPRMHTPLCNPVGHWLCVRACMHAHYLAQFLAVRQWWSLNASELWQEYARNTHCHL